MEHHQHDADHRGVHQHGVHQHGVNQHRVHQHRGGDAGGPGATADADAFAELLDLDAEVLHAYLSELTGWVRQLAGDRAGRRIVDLGAGTGTGTVALARRFGDAEVIAVDGSGELLSRIQARARDLGLAGRVTVVRADLDTEWPAVGAVDLAWASMSLHHLADPDRVLRDVFAALRPGGLLAVAEMDSSLRFLPDDVGRGRPGLEARGQDALAGPRGEALPHLGSDWGLRLAGAGFEVTARRTFTIDLAAPLPAAAGRYAWLSLSRARAALEGQLAADDLATLDALLATSGPDSLLHRRDLVIRGTRTAWAARRP
jgi:SAM-dependent methyltransferase